MSGELVQLGLFAAGAFVAALVAGVSGFAFAPLAASVWLHLFTPLETAMAHGSGVFMLASFR